MASFTEWKERFGKSHAVQTFGLSLQMAAIIDEETTPA